MIAAHTGGTVDDAFILLCRCARDTNRRLSAVAFDVVNRHLDPTTLSGRRGH